MLEPKSERLNENIKMRFPKEPGVSWTLPGVDKHLQLIEITREVEISGSWESVQDFHLNQDLFRSFLSPKNKQDFAPLREFLAQAHPGAARCHVPADVPRYLRSIGSCEGKKNPKIIFTCFEYK